MKTMTPPTTKAGLSVTEAALLVGRRFETVYRAIRNGRIKATQINGEWVVDRASLLRYVRSRRSKAAKALAERDCDVSE